MTKLVVDLTKTESPEDVRSMRCAAIALLWAMPDDEVQLVINGWKSLCQARLLGEQLQQRIAAAAADDPVGGRLFRVERGVTAAATADDLDEIIEVKGVRDDEVAAMRTGVYSGHLGARGDQFDVTMPQGSAVDAKPDDDTGHEQVESDVTAPEKHAKPLSYEQFTFDDKKYKTHHRGPATAKNAAIKLIEACGSVAELDVLVAEQITALCGVFTEIGRGSDLGSGLTEAVEARRQALARSEDADGREPPEMVADIADTLDFGADATGDPPKENGEDQPMTTRELVSRAEHELGRAKVWAVFQQHGVEKIKDLTGEVEAAFRADLEALL